MRVHVIIAAYHVSVHEAPSASFTQVASAPPLSSTQD